MNTKVKIAGVELKNPVMTASGTFGSGMEFSEFTDLNKLGAVVTKGVANVPWEGNPTPRIAETYGGMLNAIGLQNPGIDLFVKRDLPFLEKYDTKVVVNVCGHSENDYIEVVERLADEKVDLLIKYLRQMNDDLNIPHCIKNYGEGGLPAEEGIVPEDEFLEKLHDIAANAILDACTGSNPRQPSQEDMEKLLKCCYYDTEVDF